MDFGDLFDPRMEKWCSADTCLREIVHHPRKGGSSNILGELNASEFRLRFTSMQPTADEPLVYNKGFLKPYDIPIVSIYRITLFNRKKKHKKEVSATDLIRSNSEELEYSSMIIYCADFTIYKFSTVNEETNFPADFLDLVLNFGVRRRTQDLFGIVLGVAKLKSLNLVHKNRSPDDAWLREFPIEFLVRRPRVPSDQRGSAPEAPQFDPEHFAEGRTPRISCKVGSNFPSVLLRCGKIAKGRRNTIEHELRDACMSCGFLSNGAAKGADSDQQVKIVKLKNLGLPRPDEVLAARRRLREISLGYDPEGNTTAWLEQLDTTQWMSFVSRALRIAYAIAYELQRDLGTALMLSEGCDSDWNCVICSLVNLLLFPRLRSVVGLRELVVREWCAAEHPFAVRLEIAQDAVSSERSGPLFSLFLDCVQQVWSQFPQCFAFAPEFLIALHDLSHIGLFREFLIHVNHQHGALAPSVFDLKPLLSPDGAELFENPVFGLAVEMWRHKKTVDDDDEPSLEMQLEAVVAGKTWLEVDSSVRHLRFWRENYLRALSFMDIGQAGRPAELWRYRELLMQARLKRIQSMPPVVLGMLDNEEAMDVAVQLRNEANIFRLPSGADFQNVTAFFPFAKETEKSGGKSSRGSFFPGRGVSHFDMYGDAGTL